MGLPMLGDVYSYGDRRARWSWVSTELVFTSGISRHAADMLGVQKRVAQVAPGQEPRGQAGRGRGEVQEARRGVRGSIRPCKLKIPSLCTQMIY